MKGLSWELLPGIDGEKLQYYRPCVQISTFSLPLFPWIGGNTNVLSVCWLEDGIFLLLVRRDPAGPIVTVPPDWPEDITFGAARLALLVTITTSSGRDHTRGRSIFVYSRFIMSFLLRIRGASQIVQVCKENERVLVGSAMKRVAILKEEIVGSKKRSVGVVVNGEGKIDSLGWVL